MPRSDNRHDAAALLTLAERKGYALDVSVLPDCWRLIGNDLKAVKASDGSTEHTSAQAKAFLLAQPDA